MGSGKSFYGKRLASKLNMDFIDLDHLIEKKEGQSISDIFATKNEKGFRQIEKKYLESLQKKTNVVIACGGGTPCFYNNMQWMNENGKTIYLKTSKNLLLQRLKEGQRNRPLLENLSTVELRSFIKSKMETRAHKYEMAEQVVYQRVGDLKYLEKLLNLLNH